MNDANNNYLAIVIMKWIFFLVALLSSAVLGSDALLVHGHASIEDEQESSPSSMRTLVISVMDRPANKARLRRLTKQLHSMHFSVEVIWGPNMDKYCPADIRVPLQSKEAGLRLLVNEWRGLAPPLNTYNLELYQIATLVGHMRAWQQVADTGVPAIIFEDDADVFQQQALRRSVAQAKSSGANAVILDPRHCHLGESPPHLPHYAYGLTGYWIDPVAAKTLLAHFSLRDPVDTGVNSVFNSQVKAICPLHFGVKEYGGEAFARTHSAALGCGLDGAPAVAAAAHPVALQLHASFSGE